MEVGPGINQSSCNKHSYVIYELFTCSWRWRCEREPCSSLLLLRPTPQIVDDSDDDSDEDSEAEGGAGGKDDNKGKGGSEGLPNQPSFAAPVSPVKSTANMDQPLLAGQGQFSEAAKPVMAKSSKTSKHIAYSAKYYLLFLVSWELMVRPIQTREYCMRVQVAVVQRQGHVMVPVALAVRHRMLSLHCNGRPTPCCLLLVCRVRWRCGLWLSLPFTPPACLRWTACKVPSQRSTWQCTSSTASATCAPWPSSQCHRQGGSKRSYTGCEA